MDYTILRSHRRTMALEVTREAAVDYVVVHELAHIRCHDHSPAFYALVEQYIPDWRERMKLLKD